jgi:hypothetical protein
MSNQSALTTIPTNTSMLQANKFTFVFPNLPFARYFCQNVSIPGVSTTAIGVPTPFTTSFRHGTSLSYEDFSINAIIDEEMMVWEETYKWLKGLTRPTEYEDYIKGKANNGEIYHDAILTINTNANIPNVRIKFHNCHPTNLGSVRFSVSETADTILTADITFRYDYFEFERL